MLILGLLTLAITEPGVSGDSRLGYDTDVMSSCARCVSGTGHGMDNTAWSPARRYPLRTIIAY